jgi:transcriptional regulator with XRE-family HTH domain
MEKLKEIRKSHSLSQHQVAASLDISISTYRKWEQGVYTPIVGDIWKLADFFDCMMSDFFLDPPGQKPSASKISTSDERELVLAYRMMKPQDQKTTLDLAVSLAGKKSERLETAYSQNSQDEKPIRKAS